MIIKNILITSMNVINYNKIYNVKRKKIFNVKKMYQYVYFNF